MKAADIPVDGAQLRYRRQRAGLTQEGLAAIVRAKGGQLSSCRISRVERGVSARFRIPTYAVLCEVLDVEHDVMRSDRPAAAEKTPV